MDIPESVLRNTDHNHDLSVSLSHHTKCHECHEVKVMRHIGRCQTGNVIHTISDYDRRHAETRTDFHLKSCPSNLRVFVNTTVLAGMLSPIENVSVANKILIRPSY